MQDFAWPRLPEFFAHNPFPVTALKNRRPQGPALLASFFRRPTGNPIQDAEGRNPIRENSVERVAHGMRMAINRQEGVRAEKQRENHGQPSRRRNRNVNPSPGPEPDSIFHGCVLFGVRAPAGRFSTCRAEARRYKIPTLAVGFCSAGLYGPQRLLLSLLRV